MLGVGWMDGWLDGSALFAPGFHPDVLESCWFEPRGWPDRLIFPPLSSLKTLIDVVGRLWDLGVASPVGLQVCGLRATSWGTSDIGRLWESSECHEISIVYQSRESAWVQLDW